MIPLSIICYYTLTSVVMIASGFLASGSLLGSLSHLNILLNLEKLARNSEISAEHQKFRGLHSK